MQQEAVPQPDKELILHYIDKVHSSLTGTITALNRVWILLVVFSFILIILCFGLVSTSNSGFSYGGLNLIVPFWIIIFGGAWVIGILFIYMLSLETQRGVLVEEIIKLYKSIGYENDSMKLGGTGALEIPNMMTIAIESIKFESIINIPLSATFVVVLLVPLGAEIIACYKTIATFGWKWWIIASFLLLFLLSISYLISYVHSILSESPATRGKAQSDSLPVNPNEENNPLTRKL